MESKEKRKIYRLSNSKRFERKDNNKETDETDYCKVDYFRGAIFVAPLFV